MLRLGISKKELEYLEHILEKHEIDLILAPKKIQEIEGPLLDVLMKKVKKKTRRKKKYGSV